jgi:hypothetical protein
MKLLEKAANFAKSTAVFVLAGMPIATENQIYERLKLCSKCINFDPNSYAGNGECKICGCCMEIKASMATEKCPIGIWDEIK